MKKYSMCIEQIIEISKGLLTPVIAIITTYIAWQQWKTNQQKLNLDLYERRLKIYEEVIKILSIILRDADVSLEDLLKFRTYVSEADFLFGEEIPSYIDEIYKRGVALRRYNQECRSDTQEIKEYNDKKDKELQWFIKQFEPAKEKFKMYLHIG